MNLKDHRRTGLTDTHATGRVGAACAPWTLLLPDAAEGLLSDVERQALDRHLAGCPECSAELLAAQQGLAWLTVLKETRPAPPEDLLASILARTTGMEETGVSLPEVHAPYGLAGGGSMGQIAGIPLLPAESLRSTMWRWLRGDPDTWSTLLQPRLAMTGAMAFFSICLTLNLFGVSVSQLDAQGFEKTGLHQTVTRGESLVRSLQGLRLVYKVQARVNEMRAQMDGPAEGHAQ